MTKRRCRRVIAAFMLTGLACAAGAPQGASASDGATYTVRPNDTLSGIALSYGTTVQALMDANSLRSPDRITAGQILLIHSDGATGSTATAGSGADVAPAASQGTLYIVRSGDTLSDISLRLGLSMNDLAAANNLKDWCVLYVGQRLVLPTAVTPQGQGSTVQPLAAAPATAAGTMVTLNTGTIEAILTAQAQAAGVDTALVKALAWQESGWQMVVASDGGMGVMQLMPDTVDWVSTTLVGYRVNPYDATDNVRAGVAMMRYYLRVFGGDVHQALAAYHQGLTGVRTQGILPETAHYVSNILALQQRF